jgi:hypothetical protein
LIKCLINRSTFFRNNFWARGVKRGDLGELWKEKVILRNERQAVVMCYLPAEFGSTGRPGKASLHRSAYCGQKTIAFAPKRNGSGQTYR